MRPKNELTRIVAVQHNAAQYKRAYHRNSMNITHSAVQIEEKVRNEGDGSTDSPANDTVRMQIEHSK